MFSSLKNSDFIKKVYVIMAGTLLAQIITLTATPLITRLYSPEVFGFFSNVMAMAVVLVIVLTLSFSLAIVLPKKINNALALAKFSVTLASCMALFLVLLESIVGFGQYTNLGLISIYELILLAYLLAIFEIFGFWLLKMERFKFRAKLLVMQALLVVLLKIGLGYFYPAENSLLYAAMIGLFVVNLAIVFFSGIPQQITKKTLMRGYLTAKEYVYIAKYRTPQNLLASFNQLLPILMLTSMYGAAVAGMYALARGVLLLPGLLIAKSVGDVLLPKLSGMYNANKALNKIVVKSALLLSIIGLFPLFAIYFYGEILFSIVFGEEWSSAGEYAKWLSVWLYFNFMNKPYITLIPILKLEKVFWKNSVFNTLLTVLGLWVGYTFYGDANHSIAYFCMLTIIPQIIILFITHKTMLAHDRSLEAIRI
jgi:O-antigen/teichoic acid export membrane protein